MSIISEIRRAIEDFPEDYIFTASDFKSHSTNPTAVIKALVGQFYRGIYEDNRQ